MMANDIQRAAVAFIATVGTVLLVGAGAHADPVADFYRGKQLKILIGYGAGGGGSRRKARSA